MPPFAGKYQLNSSNNSDDDSSHDELKTGISNQLSTANRIGNQMKSKNSKRRGVVFIRNLPNRFLEEIARKYFMQFGNVTRIRLSGRPRPVGNQGSALVIFKFPESAKMAAAKINDFTKSKKIIKIEKESSDSSESEAMMEMDQSKSTSFPLKRLWGNTIEEGDNSSNDEDYIPKGELSKEYYASSEYSISDESSDGNNESDTSDDEPISTKKDIRKTRSLETAYDKIIKRNQTNGQVMKRFRHKKPMKVSCMKQLLLQLSKALVKGNTIPNRRNLKLGARM